MTIPAIILLLIGATPPLHTALDMPPPQKPIKFGEPEKPNIWGKVTAWVLVLAGLGAIAWMISSNTKQKPLVCKNSAFGGASLNNFGTCTTD